MVLQNIFRIHNSELFYQKKILILEAQHNVQLSRNSQDWKHVFSLRRNKFGLWGVLYITPCKFRSLLILEDFNVSCNAPNNLRDISMQERCKCIKDPTWNSYSSDPCLKLLQILKKLRSTTWWKLVRGTVPGIVGKKRSSSSLRL